MWKRKIIKTFQAYFDLILVKYKLRNFTIAPIGMFPSFR